MNKKKWMYWALAAVAAYVIWKLLTRKGAPLAPAIVGPQYMTYNQPPATIGVNMPEGGSFTRPRSATSCGCNPAVSQAMSGAADLTMEIQEKFKTQLGAYVDRINEQLAEMAGY